MDENNTNIMLNLNHKCNIFIADKTPTPIRLIKNCDEVGLFDDLCHVNPFEETFRRACEGTQTLEVPGRERTTIIHDEDTLHTPQVFSQFETAGNREPAANVAPLDPNLGTSTEELSLVVDENTTTITTTATLTNISSIDQKPSSSIVNTTEIDSSVKGSTFDGQQLASVTFIPSNLQYLQPHLIAVQFSNAKKQSSSDNSGFNVESKSLKSKPRILPKPTSLIKILPNENGDQCGRLPEPSSASLTPTSQLPIKERLKAIVNQSTKPQPQLRTNCNEANSEIESKILSNTDHSLLHANNVFSTTQPMNSERSNSVRRDNDLLERRRAASSRYRNRMRNEQKDLRRLNLELKIENDKLRLRIEELEKQLKQMEKIITKSTFVDYTPQLQIPASSIHLVMNIPKLVVPLLNNDESEVRNQGVSFNTRSSVGDSIGNTVT